MLKAGGCLLCQALGNPWRQVLLATPFSLEVSKVAPSYMISTKIFKQIMCNRDILVCDMLHYGFKTWFPHCDFWVMWIKARTIAMEQKHCKLAIVLPEATPVFIEWRCFFPFAFTLKLGRWCLQQGSQILLSPWPLWALFFQAQHLSYMFAFMFIISLQHERPAVPAHVLLLWSPGVRQEQTTNVHWIQTLWNALVILVLFVTH